MDSYKGVLDARFTTNLNTRIRVKIGSLHF